MWLRRLMGVELDIARQYCQSVAVRKSHMTRKLRKAEHIKMGNLKDASARSRAGGNLFLTTAKPKTLRLQAMLFNHFKFAMFFCSFA